MVIIGLFILALAASAQTHRAQSVDVKVLSTMLTDRDGIGEWGFSALVIIDGHRILFDTGARPDTVLINTRAMKVDLSNVPEVILSHNHGDHTGGLITLKKSVGPNALKVAHAGEGIFLKRDQSTAGWTPMDRIRDDYQKLGGRVVVYQKPIELYPGVWLTGPVPRAYPEKNFGIGPTNQIHMPDGSMAEDTIPEDMSLVIDTDRGLVVISGCGHSGIVNTLEYARKVVRKAPVHAAIGGFHLFQLDDEKLKWTAGKLREFGIQNFMGAHCTGIEATYRIRDLAGLSRQTAAVAAVGAEFKLGEPMRPGSIAR
jgi:7,8-dihydropterin-6-yl-methyl-4-(beta-D-ribofuranosyl)aminobenzene 5'-phosphate synthase